jgi:hypothetical protein
MEAKSYDLRNFEYDSSRFYFKRDERVEVFLIKAKSNSQFIINQYIEYLNVVDPKKSYSITELYLEFLYLGAYSKVYSIRAKTCPKIWIEISKKLNNWRNKRPELRRLIDFLRSIAFRNMNSSKESKKVKFNHDICFNSLIKWMEATGEFDGEIAKLKKWYDFLLTMSNDRAKAIINRSIELADYFEHLCQGYLGEYTHNMDILLSLNKSESIREDVFLRP